MSVYYKFKSSKDYDTINLEGPVISLGDLKRAIIEKKLGKATDCDLKITNAQTGEEYDDDICMISKNTSVIVRRIPASKFHSGLPYPQTAPKLNYTLPTEEFGSKKEIHSESEADKIREIVNSSAGLHYNMTRTSKPSKTSKYVENKAPPPSYICHRCNQPGHFINHCPTNGDPSYDIHKVKKPTGIPRSYLKPVTGGKSGATLMMPGGGFAVMQPNSAEFDKFAHKSHTIFELKNIPPDLQCSICQGILIDPVRVPCCSASFCDECIRNELLNNNLTCPSCKHNNTSPDSLIIDKTLQQQVANIAIAS